VLTALTSFRKTLDAILNLTPMKTRLWEILWNWCWKWKKKWWCIDVTL